MKNTKMIRNEILLRGKEKQEQKNSYLLKRNGIGIVTVSLCLLTTLFCVGIVHMPVSVEQELAYGTVLYMNDRIGGYVLIGVIAFVLGAIAVIIYKKISFYCRNE